MKKIAIIAFILGILLATTAYVAEINDWQGVQEFMTLGFIGYIFIISSAAYLLVNLLHEWSRENEAYQSR